MILDDVLNAESSFYTKIEGKIHFTCIFREVFNHFIYIPSFSLRVYLVLAKSKILITNRFALRIFKKVSVNVRTFISFQMFTSPGGNVSVGFTHITGVTASTENLINYIGLQTIWNLIFSSKKRRQFKCVENNFDIGTFLTKLLSQFL